MALYLGALAYLIWFVLPDDWLDRVKAWAGKGKNAHRAQNELAWEAYFLASHEGTLCLDDIIHPR